MSALSLRRETAEDEDFLRGLWAEARAAEFAVLPLGGEQKEALMRMQFDWQRSQYRAQYSGADFMIVMQGDIPAGRFYVVRGNGEFLVIDITLAAAYQNRGLGTRLLQALMTEAAGEAKPIRLYVRWGNRAMNLYCRLGFSILEDDGMDVLMEWNPHKSLLVAP